MTLQQQRMLEIMRVADSETIDRLFCVAASIIGILPAESSRLAVPVSSDPSFPKS